VLKAYVRLLMLIKVRVFYEMSKHITRKK